MSTSKGLNNFCISMQWNNMMEIRVNLQKIPNDMYKCL